MIGTRIICRMFIEVVPRALAMVIGALMSWPFAVLLGPDVLHQIHDVLVDERKRADTRTQAIVEAEVRRSVLTYMRRRGEVVDEPALEQLLNITRRKAR